LLPLPAAAPDQVLKKLDLYASSLTSLLN